MRHEQIFEQASYTKVDVAAVWPAGLQIAPLPLLDLEDVRQGVTRSSAAVPDVPISVGKLIIASYAALLGALGLATVASAFSVFMIVICSLFTVAYFTVPWVFFRQEPQFRDRPTLNRFMRDGMETLTGHSTGRAALVQMLVIPVCLTFGVLLIGFAT